jgi:hypothetical protein
VFVGAMPLRTHTPNSAIAKPWRKAVAVRFFNVLCLLTKNNHFIEVIETVAAIA